MGEIIFYVNAAFVFNGGNLHFYFFFNLFFSVKEILSVVKYNDVNFEENPEVRKIGKATGTTTGVLTETIRSVKVDGLIFKNCFAVSDTNGKRFFESGDSGSGVFLPRDKTMQPLGIAFAFMKNHTLVCRIDKILDYLDLAIVHYSLNVK